MKDIHKTLGIIVSILIAIITWNCCLAIAIIQLSFVSAFYFLGYSFLGIGKEYRKTNFDEIWRIRTPKEKFLFYMFPMLAFGKVLSEEW